MLNIDEILPTSIDGLLQIPKKVIRDERGAVMHMVRCDNVYFDGEVGEIYFSTTKAGVIKGWKRHLEMRQRFVVPIGEIEFVFFDDRSESATKGQTYRVNLSEDNYCLLIVPPGIWYAFKGLGLQESLIANCSSLPHQAGETEFKDFRIADFPVSFS